MKTKKTKKIAALVCAIVLAVSVTACAKGGEKQTSSEESMPVPSMLESKTESSGQEESSMVSSAESSSGESEVPASSTAAKVVTKADTNKNAGGYQVKSGKYSYRKGNLDYSASYPQLAGSVTNLAKINEALEKSSMQTIQSMGTAERKQKASVRVTGDVTYEGKAFLSVGFNEYVKPSPTASSTHTMRTVNYNLKTGTAVGFKDMIRVNDAFYKALEAAAKKQLPDQASALTAAAIQSGLDQNAIYFTDSSVGFCVKVSKPEQKLVRVTLDYAAVKPFATQNAGWSSFI